MATLKQYAYKVKGNKLSILERDFTPLQDGQSLTAPGVELPSGGGTWKSPMTTVTDGLEIEYVYSPSHYSESTNTYGNGLWLMNGWTVVDGYLTFLRADYSNGLRDHWTNLITNDQYILIEGSNRWNGVHKVQQTQERTGTSHAGVKTYTKVNQTVGYVSEAGNTQVNETLTSMDDLTVYNLPRWDYVWISGVATLQMVGLYGKPKVTDGGLDFSESKYYHVADVEDSEETVFDRGVWGSETGVTMHFREAFKDSGMKMHLNVNVLNDENDDIDLPIYLTKALILYVKAKIAEDAMNVEMKEYFMKEFRKMVEKHESGKIWGSRRIMTGSGAIR